MRARENTIYRNAATIVAVTFLLSGCLSSGGEGSGTLTAPSGSQNRAPTISGTPAASVEAGQAYSFTPAASDPDGDTLSFSGTNVPTWASLNGSTGALSGTPAASDAGDYTNISITVSDGELSSSIGPFSINVVTDNAPPVISGNPPATVAVGAAYAFTPTASDPNGDTLAFSIANRPSWATFSAVDGSLTGTPAAGDVGSYGAISITVSDGSLTDTLGPFSIEVAPGSGGGSNAPPVISGTAEGRVAVGTPYEFTPTASDPDGDTLTFSIANRPPWLSFDAANGRLSGTPGEADIGIHDAISITVSDGSLSDTLGPFGIEVVPGSGGGSNTPPTISGTPDPEVMAGTAYSFTPAADDADGDTLTFSIVGQPSWASFSTSTGELSGTPQEADVGTYSGVVVTVSDGTDSADLGPFTITVTAIVYGSVTLNWTAPTLNEDGSALSDLDGYKIYWGTSPGVYTDSLTIDNESLTTYVIENLPVGTYEFVATSFNTAGVESRYSNTATKTVTAP